MVMQDPIADLLTRIRNAQQVKKTKVEVPSSKLKETIVKVLKEEGYINDYAVSNDEKAKKTLTVVLKYFNGKPVIESIKRVSKPSLRQYVGNSDIPRVRGGLGIAIVSTPKGVMSDKSARKLNLGGEILCVVE